MGDIEVFAELTQICNTSYEEVDCNSMVDLTPLVENGHISDIPQDPQIESDADGTGYYLGDMGASLIAAGSEARPVSHGREINFFEVDESFEKIETEVRDVTDISNPDATVEKDIYCGVSGGLKTCVFWEKGEEIKEKIIPEVEERVYQNLLWMKNDAPDRMWGGDEDKIEDRDLVGYYLDPDTVVASNERMLGDDNYSVLDSNYSTNNLKEGQDGYPAMDECRALGSGWRLPDIVEFDGIRDMNEGPPYSKLPNIGRTYWSSTEFSGLNAWNIYFDEEEMPGEVRGSDKYFEIGVRCVRGK